MRETITTAEELERFTRHGVHLQGTPSKHGECEAYVCLDNFSCSTSGSGHKWYSAGSSVPAPAWVVLRDAPLTVTYDPEEQLQNKSDCGREEPEVFVHRFEGSGETRETLCADQQSDELASDVEELQEHIRMDNYIEACDERLMMRSRDESSNDEAYAAAAMWGLADNQCLSVEARLAAALQALSYYGQKM